MINNFWEEQLMSNNILDFHKSLLEKMDIPDWAVSIQCPFCKEQLSVGSIRTISMKLNTRNMGDLALEFICNHCSSMDTLYFRKEIEHMSDFISLLGSQSWPKSPPVAEEDMYNQKYNNVVEKMIEKEKSNDTI